MRLVRMIEVPLSRDRRQPGLDGVHLIGGDGRHAGERQFQRHRSGRGERRPRLAEGGLLFRLVGDDARLHRPLRR